MVGILCRRTLAFDFCAMNRAQPDHTHEAGVYLYLLDVAGEILTWRTTLIK